MKRGSSLRIVIDASVARSAGETEHPVSSACRKYLLAVLEKCHRAVVTDDILEEWDRHQSNFTRKWRRSMAARKKPLSTVEPTPVNLDLEAFSEVHRAAVEKDLRLLEAAIATDRVIATRDDAFRVALGTTRRGRSVRDRLTWHNPVTDDTAP
jgi:hypothetical protein